MRVLLVGETWTTVTTVVNGVNELPGRATAHDSASLLAERLGETGFSVDRLPGERVNVDFPDASVLRERYDVVVIGDVGSDSFLLHPGMYADGEPQTDRLEGVCDFVRAGGGVLMVGGYLSFSGYRGIARYGRTALGRALPVHIPDHDDRIERPAGVVPAITQPSHPVLRGIEGPWPPFLGYNGVTAREGADVLATVGTDPLLVVGSLGRGRSAAFTSDCAPHWATREFLAWEHYGRLFANLVRWLGAGTGATQALGGAA